jgi:hypothetical protein
MHDLASKLASDTDAFEARVRRASESELREIASGKLNEDHAIALVARRDLPGPVLESLAKNTTAAKSRPLMIAIVKHPRTPRHVSLPVVRHLYTFELMQVALTPETPADVRLFTEEQIANRLSTLSSGERLTLAKRASTRVAAALLLDPEKRVTQAAMENPRLTEMWVVKAVMNDDAPEHFVAAISRHHKWSVRREVQIALLRNDKTPFARVLHFVSALPTQVLKDVLANTRLSANVKMYLIQVLEQRKGKGSAAG